MDAGSKFRRLGQDWLPGILLVAATLTAYGPALKNGFVWDDSGYLTRPDLRSWRGLERIWFQVGSTEQYYPALHTAFWLEHRGWGDAPLGYHAVNVLLHAAAACLLALVLRRLAIPGAWLAGLLFALHPVAVESVAWIAEQKNTLSAVFYLAAALAYLRWREIRPAARSPVFRRGIPWLYLLASALFLLAVLSKSTTATLPASLLVVCWWRPGRRPWRADLAALAPWLAAGVAGGLFTAWVERTYIGAAGQDFHFSLLQRILIAGHAFWFYLGKLVWPHPLIFIYPRWKVDPAAAGLYLYPIAAAALLAGLWLCRGRNRGLLAAALLFAIALFPTLGFLNVYAFIFSFVADHWQYLAMPPILALAADGWARWAGSRSTERGVRVPFRRESALLAAVAALGVLGTLTWRQVHDYRDRETLYRTTIARNPDSWMAHDNLGVLLLNQGRVDEAAAQFQETLEIRPDYAEAHYNLATALTDEGRLGESAAEYQKAAAIDPAMPEFHQSLGVALMQEGRMDAAIAQLQRALELDPNFVAAHNVLGVAFLQSGRIDEAIAHFEQAVKLNPGFAEGHSNLGTALLKMGRLDEAVAQYQRAIAIDPRNPEFHRNLGLALLHQGRTDAAEAQMREAFRLR